MPKFRLLTRRVFVQLLGYSALAGLAWPLPRAARAAEGYAGMAKGALREYFLTIGRAPFAPSGKPRMAIMVNGMVPGPLLRFHEGETAVIHVTNTLNVDTSIHWHGVLVPANMDGVPGISFPGIKPGETFTYTFPVKQSGTYWYHSHSEFQEQQGLYGPLVIEPKRADPYGYDLERVIMLSDWTDEDPVRVMGNLKRRSDYYNFNKRTVGDFFRDIREDGLKATVEERLAWGRMRMDPTDIADVTGYTYTFLMNGKNPAENFWVGYQPGQRVRLRLINGSAMTYFDFRIPGLKLTVVQADGQNVRPVVVDQIRIAVAETYDVIVEPEDGQAYTIFAEAMDRSGYARGTLSVQEGAAAPIPEPGERPIRTMADMPGMGGMSGHSASPASGSHTGHAMSMAGMEAGYQTGDGANGRRVLDYRELKALDPFYDQRPPGREITIRLNGNMERYIWAIDGKRLQDADPIRLELGERVRFTFVNETMMEHPMHLHGMWMQLPGDGAGEGARKHTLSINPNQSVSVDVTADAPGTWAFHCHLLYHMLAGMFTTVIVSENGEGAGHAHG